MKTDKDFFHEISHLIKASYFESPLHENIFKAVAVHFEAYNNLPPDDVITEALKKLKADDEYISDYKDELKAINNLDIQSVTNKEYYLNLIEDFARKQAIKDAFLSGLNHLKSGEIGRIEHEMKNALGISRNVDLGTDYTKDFFTRWDRSYTVNVANKIATGIYTLDGCLDGGLGRKELSMVVAPPGVGKSLFLTHIGTMALLQGLNVLHVSLEMSEDRVAQRYDSNLTNISQVNLKNSKKEAHERIEELFEKVEKNTGKMPILKIKEFPTGQLNAHGLRAYMAQVSSFEDFHPDLIILDYLELMRPTTVGMAEYQAQERIAQELRGIAAEYELLMWTATQTNRDGKRVPLISDTELADAYGKTRTCDLAISLNQTSEEFDQGQARLYVFKSRNSRTKFVVDIKIDYDLLTVREA
ncbi:AAA family ATPase [Candidatus Woesearchaeota archaeon]|nr:AAA family ATPase [Candidatus Woesearchaeota archaeon]